MKNLFQPKLHILFILALVGAQGIAQPKITAFDEPRFKQARVPAHITFLTDNEKEVIALINFARIDGKLFRDTYALPYLDTASVEKDSRYVKTLLYDLKRVRKRTPLAASELLTTEARSHAKDMGSSGKVGHAAADGKSFKERMKEIVDVHDGVGENCDYGSEHPLSIVMSMLIDVDNKDANHRHNLLDTRFQYIGVAIEPHSVYEINCVQLLGARAYR